MPEPAQITMRASHGSIWAAGELVAGCGRTQRIWDIDKRDEYSILLCVEPRKIGPRGRVLQPARMADIRGRSWSSVCRAVRSLGFTAPKLTAAEVRKGKR